MESGEETKLPRGIDQKIIHESGLRNIAHTAQIDRRLIHPGRPRELAPGSVPIYAAARQ